ncbi:hypothetical protein GBF38_018511 [Nibea albiflora]|uniref:Uncharacterized protein n=1 Tax=Nibea albiflora TaxID=240163 RepID=A0ACB7EMX3_NIBAL|nr:hypothetical protein GBF38_018511 [Nibea albiflora]
MLVVSGTEQVGNTPGLSLFGHDGRDEEDVEGRRKGESEQARRRWTGVNLGLTYSRWTFTGELRTASMAVKPSKKGLPPLQTEAVKFLQGLSEVFSFAQQKSFHSGKDESSSASSVPGLTDSYAPSPHKACT